MNTLAVSAIITILNEEASIGGLLESFLQQTKLPNEIIIVDAGSKDNSKQIIRKFAKSHPNLPIKLLEKNGNRSIGRNEAIAHAQHNIIVSTDAGCVLHPSWLEKITDPFQESEIDVVCGWYQIQKNTTWDSTLAYMLNFNSEEVKTNKFLPSTRSVAFKKKVWEDAGGFDENLSYNEDTPFGLALRSIQANFYFEADAIVYWKAPRSYRLLFKTLYKYAYGDGEARLFLPHYKLLICFWLYVLLTIFFFLITKLPIFLFLLFLASIYLFIPIIRNPKVLSFQQLLQLFLMRIILLTSTTLGYVKGLLAKSKRKRLL